MPRSSVICVTGATGFLAMHIIKKLLAQGTTVRGRVFVPARKFVDLLHPEPPRRCLLALRHCGPHHHRCRVKCCAVNLLRPLPLPSAGPTHPHIH